MYISHINDYEAKLYYLNNYYENDIIIIGHIARFLACDLQTLTVMVEFKMLFIIFFDDYLCKSTYTLSYAFLAEKKAIESRIYHVFEISKIIYINERYILSIMI